MRSREPNQTVLAYAVPPGLGGLGHHAADLLANLGPLFPRLRVYGPSSQTHEPPAAAGMEMHTPPPDLIPAWRRRYTWLRYMTGAHQQAHDERYGRWLATALAERPFERGYFLTQIARESLVLARRGGAQTILDSPTGHIRHLPNSGYDHLRHHN